MNKRTFDLTLAVVVFGSIALGLAKTWARRIVAERQSGTAGSVAGGVIQTL